MRALKRPIYGLVDDDGFDYTGNSDEPIASHKRGDVQSNTPAWFRFGEAWNMVGMRRIAFGGVGGRWWW